MIRYEHHPVADLFPLMPDPELEALAKDIEANGLREPIWLHPDGRIIDGRNRYRACMLVGVEPHTRVWDGEGDLVAFVVSLNLHRRHLNEAQRAMVAAKVANMGHGGARRSDQEANLPLEDAPAPVTVAKAAELLNVSERTVKDARKVRNEGTPELVTAVESGGVAVSAAAAVAARRPPERQVELVSKGPQAIREEAKVIREEQRQERRYSFLARWTAGVRPQGAALIAEIPESEHPEINRLLDAPGIPEHSGMAILRNLIEMGELRRAEIYRLNRSDNPADRSLALTKAAALPPMPDARLLKVKEAIRIVDWIQKRTAPAESALHGHIQAAAAALVNFELAMEEANDRRQAA